MFQHKTSYKLLCSYTTIQPNQGNYETFETQVKINLTGKLFVEIKLLLINCWMAQVFLN